MKDCVFCKIAKRELPAKIVYEDEEILVFPDIVPVAPLHLLIMPKAHIEDLMSPEAEDGKLWAKMTKIAKDLIKKNNLKGYRLVLNGGEAKLVNHLHLHLMGGVSQHRKM